MAGHEHSVTNSHHAKTILMEPDFKKKLSVILNSTNV